MAAALPAAAHRVIAIAEACGEFILDVDGCTYWQPTLGSGHLAAHHLRWLAAELDQRNQHWCAELAAHFAKENSVANSQLTFTNINFTIEPEITHCEVRWSSDDPILCGYGARRSFPGSLPVSEILNHVNMDCLTDPRWTVIR